MTEIELQECPNLHCCECEAEMAGTLAELYDERDEAVAQRDRYAAALAMLRRQLWYCTQCHVDMVKPDVPHQPDCPVGEAIAQMEE